MAKKAVTLTLDKLRAKLEAVACGREPKPKLLFALLS